MSNQVIAIDGPVASGKGTVACLVAAKLGWNYLDSGALYRLTALHAQQKAISWDDEIALAQLALNLPITFSEQKIYLASQEVSDLIRQEEIGMGASKIAALTNVRTALLSKQRDFRKQGNLVADGRDMGSVVFPDAILKVFLTANILTRAERRAHQIGVAVDSDQFKQIYQAIEARDLADRTRSVAPLLQAKDAKLLDSSNLSIAGSVKKIIDWYQELSI